MLHILATFVHGALITLTLTVIALIAVSWIYLFVMRIKIHLKTPILALKSEQTSDIERPKVSVIVTARNEGKNIGACLRSLSAQTYHSLGIIVVDDASEDNTRNVVFEHQSVDKRVRLVEAGIKPKSWAGKTWACWRGAREAGDGWILFTDADTHFHPDAISSAMQYAMDRDLDFLSLSPRIICDGFWSALMLPVPSSLLTMFYPMLRANNPHDKKGYGYGSFILAGKSSYIASGGHMAVKHSIVEDKDLMQNAKDKGFSIRVIRGDTAFDSKWSSDFKEVWWSMERVIGRYLMGRVPAGVQLALAVFFLFTFPFVMAILSGLWLLYYEGLFKYAAFVMTTVTSSLILFVLGVEMSTMLKVNKRYVLAAPLSGLLFASVILSATYKTGKGKGLTWKGRIYYISSNAR